MERLTEKQLHILRQKLCDMKNRCYNPQNKFYKDYGGRGITVCSEWLDKKNGHKNFREWALENGWKEGYSIEDCKESDLWQIAEWLEDLKAIKEMDLDIPQHFTKEQSDWIKAYCIRRNIEFYNKAIDDFVKFASTMPTVEEKDGTIRPMWLEEMAEQLKSVQI